jgi:hypothetical protein
MSAYEAGFKKGQQIAERVLDLEYFSEMKRSTPEDIPDQESLPLGEDDRCQYLKGYAIGIIDRCLK